MSDVALAFVILPVLLFCFNVGLKWLFKAELHFAGADLALIGVSLLLSWFAGALSRGMLPPGGEGLWIFISCIVVFGFWILSLAIARYRRDASFVLSSIIGASVVIWSASRVHNLIQRGYF